MARSTKGLEKQSPDKQSEGQGEADSKTQDEIYVQELTGAFKKSIAYENVDLIEQQKGEVDYVNDGVIRTIWEGRKQPTQLPRNELLKSLFSRILSESNWQRNYLKNAPKIMHKNVWEDLGIISINSTQPDQSLMNLLASPNTVLGQMQMGVLLVTPTDDVEELSRRQRILKYFMGKGADGRRKLREQFALNEKQVERLVQFWNSFDIYSEKNSAVFRVRSPLAYLGNGEVPVNAVALYNRSKFFSGFLPTLAVLLKHEKNPLSKNVLVQWIPEYLKPNKKSLVFAAGAAGLGIFQYFSQTYPQLRIINAIKERLRSVRDIVRLARYVRDRIQNDSVLARELRLEMEPIERFLSGQGGPLLRRILNNLEHSSLCNESILSPPGVTVSTLIQIINHKNKFADLLMALGRIDAYLAVSQRLVDHDLLQVVGDRDPAQLSFAEFETGAESPHVALRGFWTPFLAPDEVVVNDVNLGGGKDIPRIGIFSGPNAGGKSTLMKAVGYNVLLAQTFGISFSRSMTFTPFSNITTYMNITDDVLLGQSLFKAEVNRAKAYLDILGDLTPSEFSFSILDEVFSGTNPKEGAATAFSAIHNIGLHPQVLGMVATHYENVSHLAERVKEPGIFTSFHVALTDKGNGQLNPDFKLYEGSTDQSGAIEILRKEGFAPEILDEAMEIFEN